jgi:DNA-binding transcriptional MocR family regulator
MKFAKRMGKFESNELLALMQLADNPDVISFAGGFPAPKLFPLDELKKVSEKGSL